MVTSLGHSGADRSSTASRPVRSASSISPSVRTCSHPAALMWPRNELGYERRCTSPSAMAVASRPPPQCTTVWSIAAPSEDTNQVERRNRSRPPSAKVTPGTVCIRRVPSISRATFSSRGTVNGSSSTGPRQDATTGSTGESATGVPGRPAAAFAISTASVAVRTTSGSSWREVAAKPHRPPARTRTPTPEDVERSIPCISWLRTVSDSLSSVPVRASA